MLRSEVGHEKSFPVPQLKGGKKGAGAPLTLDLSGTEATLATLVDSLIYYFRMLTEWGGHTVRVIGNAKNFATRFVRGAKKCGLKVCRRASRADESGCCEPLRCSAVRAAVVVVVRLAFEKEPWHGCLRFSLCSSWLHRGVLLHGPPVECREHVPASLGPEQGWSVRSERGVLQRARRAVQSSGAV